ncbi:MAG TPA: hypothetical protein VNK41_12425 [Vicinamibacterales bacterium]|nr:hypothetical protein [Vicinamibacterales bacterium]
MGETGPDAFNPNPAPQPSGGRVVWRNDDNVVHRIVANDGSFDTGNLNPGQTSSAISVGSNGTRYHCTLHPTMVGAVNGSSGTPPPCTGLYC